MKSYVAAQSWSSSLPVGTQPRTPSDVVLQTTFASQPELCPFVRWHLRGKYRVMEDVFQAYLRPGAKFLDMACGNGECLLLASMCEPSCELWGLDIDTPGLALSQQRVPKAKLVEGDMHASDNLPKGYFDVVHEFGASCMAQSWSKLLNSYLSLLKDGGILLWELPERWSTAHVSYLLSVAPKITASDTKLKRILRSFFPGKYRFESDRALLRGLETSAYSCEIVERRPIWHFYCRNPFCYGLDLAWQASGDKIFNLAEKITSHVWPRWAGYYLVIRKSQPSA